MKRQWTREEKFTFVVSLKKKRSKGKFDRFICLRLECSIGSMSLARCNETLPFLGKKGREIRYRLIMERSRDNIHFFCFFLFLFFSFSGDLYVHLSSLDLRLCVFSR